VSETAALTGRTALVTGASRGIGKSVVLALADAGARVWCLARTEAALRALAADVGGEALVVDLMDDVAAWEALDRMVDTLGGAPDLVVNSAGAFALASSDTESVAAFDRSVAVNLRAPFLVNRALLPTMLAKGSGLIVNIGSVAGRRAFRDNASYSAAKFGLRGYHEVLLEEIRGTGVRATLLEPAATDTPLWDALDPDGDPKLPSRRDMLAPAEVAEAVLFVATRPEDVRIPLLQIERA
jgi:NADP-dependent 3-hydroxy acid dehydrogenase YdfG